MVRSARKTIATSFLMRQVELGATGRLAVGAGAASLEVYLLNGQVVAAQSPDDVRHLVRLCALRGAITESASEALENRAERSEPVFGELLDQAPPELMDQLLYDRFRQNLASYVGTSAKPSFAPSRGVFVDNLQLGHDTQGLIEAAVRLWDIATALDLDAKLVRGPARLDSKEQRLVAARLGDVPQTISSLLHQLPLEPLVARVIILSMLESGAAGVARSAESVEDEVEDAPTAHGVELPDLASLSPAPARGRAEAPAVEEELELELDLDESPPRLQPEPMQGLEEETRDPSTAPSDSTHTAVGDSAAAPAPAAPVDDAQAQLAASPAEPTAPVAPPTADSVTIAPSAPSAEARAPSVGGVGPNLTSLSAWLESATRVSEDELDFFEDHDYERGSGDEGSFSTDTHNLDRIEVSSVAAQEEALEADEAPTARYSAPVLSEEDALEKIHVANDVLSLVVRAFDEVEGAGRGRSVVQLLVDGSPSRFAELLHDVQVDEDGRLPDDAILENLYGRPPAEHRQLMNQSLADLIERALSSAADELPDETIDHVLESVAGYRQRLGL